MLNGISRRLIKNLNTNLTLYSVILVFTFCSAYFFSFIYSNTANILYWDQWDIVNEIVNEDNWINLVFFQHNEHKMGLGLVITKFLASVTSWSNQAETVLTGLVIFISAVLAVLIKKRIFGKIEIYDIFIPILFFNLYQWENLIWGFQISFVLPLLMLFLSVYLYTFKESVLRNLLLIFISLLSIFSHFHGLIIVLITFIFFILNAFHSQKFEDRRKYLGLGIISLIIGLFYFNNFTQVESLATRSNLLLTVPKNIAYIILELNQLFGLQISKNLGIFSIFEIISLLIFPLIALASFSFLLLKAKKESALIKYYPIISLFIFTFIFCILTAFGRSSLGLTQALSSRYATFIIPVFLGVYLSLLLLLQNKLKQRLIILFISIFLILSSYNYFTSSSKITSHLNNLSEWKHCYLKSRQIETCNKLTYFFVYPESGAKKLENNLSILKKHRLNLFFYE